MNTLVEKAPAKINLTLRVLGRRADGYHELESLVAFADLADTLSLQPGGDAALDITGPFAAACGPVADNLVLKAVAALRQRIGGLTAGSFQLEKNIPVAAGIGGGSADAAAALAAARARQRSCARRRAAWPRPRPRSAPMCRSASIRAAASCVAWAKVARLRSLCRHCRRCWSIRACLWRRATCSKNSPPRQGGSSAIAPTRRATRRPNRCNRAATISPPRQSPACRSSPICSNACARCRAPRWRACRARGRPVLRCLLRPAKPPPPGNAARRRTPRLVASRHDARCEPVGLQAAPLENAGFIGTVASPAIWG